LGLPEVIIAPFVPAGNPVKAKIVFLGPPEPSSGQLVEHYRSLNLEHVSPCRLRRPEISRRPASAGADEASTLALMRRWFFARKPDAGFVLTDFPATLLQAQVLDEWLETRNEALTAVFAIGSGSSDSVLQHYRTLGLVQETSALAADVSVALVPVSAGTN